MHAKTNPIDGDDVVEGFRYVVNFDNRRGQRKLPRRSRVRSIHSAIERFPFSCPTTDEIRRLVDRASTSMTLVIGVAFTAIHFGPLQGIIRENSTFGEVVRRGDSKRKRWFRLRLHIQRPSEIAFFYENRSDAFRSNDGFIRWSAGFGGLIVLLTVFCFTSNRLFTQLGTLSSGWEYAFHTIYLVIHGFGLALGVFLFSHARNSTYLRIPFVHGRMVEVSRLDTSAFLLFGLVSTAVAIATPFLFEEYFASRNGTTIFPEFTYGTQGRRIDYSRIAIEGSAVISVAGLVVYAFHRLACLMTWMKSVAVVGVGGLYFITVCMLPLVLAMLLFEVSELRNIQVLADGAPLLAMTSPFTVTMFLFNEMGSRFPRDLSTAPFYLFHGVLFGLAILGLRHRGRKLREVYLSGPLQEAN